jgi:hypothetical protein
MHRSIAERLLAIAAVVGLIVTNGAFIARLCGYIAIDTAMLTATVAGITATITGGVCLLVRLSQIGRRKLSI